MKTFKIIFTHTTSQTSRSQCGWGEIHRLNQLFWGKLVPAWLHLCLMQHLNCWCPSNPKPCQPPTVCSWKGLTQGPSRSPGVQPPHPTSGQARTGKAGQQCLRVRLYRAELISLHQGNTKEKQRTKYWDQHLEKPPVSRRPTSCLWDTAHLQSINSMIPARATLAFSSSLEVTNCLYCFQNTICWDINPHPLLKNNFQLHLSAKLIQNSKGKCEDVC